MGASENNAADGCWVASETAVLQAVTISPYTALAAREQTMAAAIIDDIFFEASGVQVFFDEPARRGFWWMWLGRYLDQEPEHAFVALFDGKPVGYLVGSLADPAKRPEFAGLSCLSSFAALTARYPAHLHINVLRAWRGGGIGERLVAAFEDHAARQRSFVSAGGKATRFQPVTFGLHVITGAGMRNVGFYIRNGFCEVGRYRRFGGGVLVMLAKEL